jgi:UDP-N-acetylglucosamine 2-epimerase
MEVENELKLNSYTYVFITGDRVESTAAACAAFHNRIPIIHYCAGILNTVTTLDDINRHVITFWSEVQLCDSECAKFHVEQILTYIGKTPNAHVVGTTLLDDILIDFSQCPEQEYNVILYNPTTFLKEKVNFFIGPNDDVRFISNLPRAQYLGLVSKCAIFATNSSSLHYEAPWLSPGECVPIGGRNASRTPPDLLPGASEKIKKIIKRLIK